MRKLETLFKEFINAPIQIYSGATFKKGLYDLLDVYDNTDSGDFVIVKGNHDIGENSIQLKDGVNWEFIGNPNIMCECDYGLFNDGGQVIDIHFNGNVSLHHRESVESRMIIVQGTRIHGLEFHFKARLDLDSGGVITANEVDSNISNFTSLVSDDSLFVINFPYETIPQVLGGGIEFSCVGTTQNIFSITDQLLYFSINQCLHNKISFNFVNYEFDPQPIYNDYSVTVHFKFIY